MRRGRFGNMAMITRVGWILLLAVGLLLPGCTAVPPDCALPEVFCVGLVTEVGYIDDNAYNQAAWEGIEQARTVGVVDGAAYIESVDPRDYDENIRFFASHGYDAIVTVGGGLTEATRAAAEQYRYIYFIGVDQVHDFDIDLESYPNLVGLVFPEDQLGFLAGALAARITETGQVGAVLAGEGWPPMRRYGEGFRAGVAYIDPSVQVTLLYHNDVDLDLSFDDLEWGAISAGTLVDNDVDILFAVGSQTGAGALLEAAARGISVIGAEVDQYDLYPAAQPRLLTSVVKRIAPGVTTLVSAARDAQAERSTFPAGTSVGQIELAPYHFFETQVSEEIQTEMLAIVDGLQQGEIYTGVLP
jgi:basic membrane protein A